MSQFSHFSDREEAAWLAALPDTRDGVDRLLAYLQEYRSLEGYLHFMGWTDCLDIPTIETLAITQREIAWVVETICDNLPEDLVELCRRATWNEATLEEFRKHGYERGDWNHEP